MNSRAHPAFWLNLVLFIGLAAAGSSAAATEPAAGPLTQEQVAAGLVQDLSAHFNLEGELQLELLRPWTPPDRMAREWRVVVTEYPAVAAAAMLVRCRLLADGDRAGECTLTLRATLWRDAWAARQPLANGADFDPALLEVRRVDFFRDRDALPATVGTPVYMFARAVGAGRLLTWRDVARRPLVRKGDLVEVTATDGRLHITMKGLALQNGAEGDSVTVRNPDSRRDFTAYVIDENRVQVRF